METQHAKMYGMQKSSSKREFHSDKCLREEKRKISSKQHNFIPQGIIKGTN